jgi:AraC-like DNA-binding protein
VETPLLQALLQNKPARIENPENPVIEKARIYIKEHIEESLKPEKLAQELNISLRNLQRIFSQELQTTPGNFILLLKMEKAADWLKEGKKPVSEIAYDLGFNDPAYFSRVFKKYFGIAPKEFRMK